MIIRGKVPLRVSFTGGGTDVSPYCDEHGGLVLSSTISMFAYASIEERNDDEVRILSLDYDTLLKYDVKDEIRYDGRLDLLKTIISTMEVKRGMNLFIHNDAPPGSGLGSSGAIGAMIVGMIANLQNRKLSNYEIADLAVHIERDIMKVAGGKQDQFAATFGGFNLMEFQKDRSIINPLRVDEDIVRELEYHLLLVYTKKTHYSGDLIEKQVALYQEHDQDHLNGLHELKAMTHDLKEALLHGRVNQFGKLLHQTWLSKKKMNKLVTTPYIDRLYERSREMGVTGGKVLGAGGGGYLLLFCPFNKKHLIAAEIERMDAKVVPFSFVEEGLRIWHVKKSDVLHDGKSDILDF